MRDTRRHVAVLAYALTQAHILERKVRARECWASHLQGWLEGRKSDFWFHNYVMCWPELNGHHQHSIAPRPPIQMLPL
eukprot:609596-Amphidinium_carterae.1